VVEEEVVLEMEIVREAVCKWWGGCFFVALVQWRQFAMKITLTYTDLHWQRLYLLQILCLLSCDICFDCYVSLKFNFTMFCCVMILLLSQCCRNICNIVCYNQMSIYVCQLSVYVYILMSNTIYWLCWTPWKSRHLQYSQYCCLVYYCLWH
jgi:hypothetical protein